jgi:uncharacterized OB-fold protein
MNPKCRRGIMALVKCMECGTRISDRANTCPECGNADIQSTLKTQNREKLILTLNQILSFKRQKMAKTRSNIARKQVTNNSDRELQKKHGSPVVSAIISITILVIAAYVAFF